MTTEQGKVSKVGYIMGTGVIDGFGSQVSITISAESILRTKTSIQCTTISDQDFRPFSAKRPTSHDMGMSELANLQSSHS